MPGTFQTLLQGAIEVSCYKRLKIEHVQWLRSFQLLMHLNHCKLQAREPSMQGNAVTMNTNAMPTCSWLHNDHA